MRNAEVGKTAEVRRQTLEVGIRKVEGGKMVDDTGPLTVYIISYPIGGKQ